MCDAVSGTTATQTITQMLDKLLKPATTQTSTTQTIAQSLDKLMKPATIQQSTVSSGQGTDTMTISSLAQQLAGTASAGGQGSAGQ
jgi:hypothetical protein